MTVKVRGKRGAGASGPDDGTPHPPTPLARVVERTFAIELRLEDVERLERELALDDHDASNPTAIRVALNRAAKNALAAHRLAIVAKVEYEIFETRCERYLAPMWEEATKAVIAERGKTNVTDKAVRAQMSKTFGDQVLLEQERRERARRTVEHLERLASLWKDRAFALNAMK